MINNYIKQNSRVDTILGPSIFGLQVPEDIFKRLVKLSEDVWERKDHISWNDQLVGHLKYQYYVPHDQLKEYDVYNFFMQCFYWYITESSSHWKNNSDSMVIELEAFWINYQEEGEYNPMHNHGQATISGALHLKEPEYEISKERKHHRDGVLSIVNHAPIMYELDNYSMDVHPTPRGMYLWPASLLHVVYPFTGKGQRVSMAYNAVHYNSNNPDNRHTVKNY